MKHLKSIFTLILPLALSCMLTSCGNDDGGSGDLDMSVSSSGIILRTSNSTCLDRNNAVISGTIARSAQANSLSLANLSLTWKKTDLDLYIGLVRVTIKNNAISGGEKVFDLDPLELEAMFGDKNQLIPRAASATAPTVRSSTSGTKANLAPACGLTVGGITVANPTSTGSFNASVTIQLIGTAQSTDLSTQKTVIKTISTTATYY